MGGCCSSGRSHSERVPVYIYYPPALEHEAFSATHGTISGLTSGVLVDTNLDTSSPDTYRAPPAPLPYEGCLAHSQASNVNLELDKNADGRVFENSTTCKSLKQSNNDGKYEETTIDDDDKSTKWKKTVDLAEEEDCPICLEEYDKENPKMVTKCEHHFHLCCILEWMERSDVCPMCDQIVAFNYGFSK